MDDKKDKKDEQDVNDSMQIKHMNNVNGNVKITIYNGTKKCKSIITHNTGTIYLCEYISKALLGTNVIAKRPYIIAPYVADVNESVSEIGWWQARRGKLNKSQKYFNTENYVSSCTLSFIIPSSNLTYGTIIKGFNLYSNDFSQGIKDPEKYLYAVLDLGEEPIEITENNINLKVDWTLYTSYTWEEM